MGILLPNINQQEKLVRKLGISHSYIVRSCNGEFKHTQGFIFSYDKFEKVEKVEIPNA
jgi:hypothetical protein